MTEEKQNKAMEKVCKKMHISVAEFIRFSIQRSLDVINKNMD